MSEHVWYFLKESFAGESQEGPLTEPQFVQLVKKGHIKKSTKICSPTRTKGQWTTVEQVPSIAALIEQGKQERAEQKTAQAASKRELKNPATSASDIQPSQTDEPTSIPPSTPSLQSGPLEPPAPPTAAAGNVDQFHAQHNSPKTYPTAPPTRMGVDENFNPKTYPWLSVVRYICYVLAGITAISLLVTFVLAIIAIIAAADSEQADLIWLMIGSQCMMLFVHSIAIVFLVFIANLIKLLIDVQTNTQLTAFNTSKMAARQ